MGPYNKPQPILCVEYVRHKQGWEKSIVINIRLRYSLLFFECTGAFTFLNEYQICLVCTLFRRNSIFHIIFYSYGPGYRTLSHFGKI